MSNCIPVGLCVPPSLKADAERRANADRLSLRDYVLALIARDVRRRPVPSPSASLIRTAACPLAGLTREVLP